MKVQVVVISLILLFISRSSRARYISHDEIDSAENELDTEFIDLSGYGDKIYGQPNESVGALLMDLIESNDPHNPEELGSYLEGDILMPQELGRSGLIDKTTRWPNGVIPYVIEGNFNSAQNAMIQNAFRAYHDKTCIKFVRRSSEKDYIIIKGDNTGCWSSVGRVGGGQVVNLQRDGCMSKIGTPIHELMHAVGFLHEQNRYDRDNHISVLFNNIQGGLEGNFDKGSSSSQSVFGVPYAYDSVMHYSANAFSKNRQPTIVAKGAGGTRMGQRDGFAAADTTRINEMYNCKGQSGSKPGGRPGGNKPSGNKRPGVKPPNRRPGIQPHRPIQPIRPNRGGVNAGGGGGGGGGLQNFFGNALQSIGQQPTTKEMGQRDFFGPTDWWRINRMYQCKNHDQGPGGDKGAPNKPAAGVSKPGASKPSASAFPGYPSGPYPSGPYPSGPYQPGHYPGPYPSGPYPSGPYPSGPNHPGSTGPHLFPSGPAIEPPSAYGPGPYYPGHGPYPYPSGPGPYHPSGFFGRSVNSTETEPVTASKV